MDKVAAFVESVAEEGGDFVTLLQLRARGEDLLGWICGIPISHCIAQSSVRIGSLSTRRERVENGLRQQIAWWNGGALLCSPQVLALRLLCLRCWRV